jgi:hypothetical protein
MMIFCFLVILSTALVGFSFNLKEKYIDNDLQKVIQSLRTSAENESIAPNVLIIVPEENNTIVVLDIFYVIVNITDDNPPLPGNVTVEISNLMVSLFNATMMINVANQWYFQWSNITSYANGETFIIRVRALDSSVNKNLGISTEMYIILDIPSSNTPGVINAVLYIITACALFAFIMVYINRRQLRNVSRKQEPNM